MNFHQNSIQSRILDPLRDSHNHANKDQKQLYESMFAKQFQIIQTFLEKINELYNKNQDFQHTICQLEDKIDRLEVNTKNIHYEFRTTHLMIDKKLNTMNNDYNNMQEQVKTLQIQRPIDKYLSSKQFLKNSSKLKARQNKRMRAKSKQRSTDQNYKIAILQSNDLNMTSPGMFGQRPGSKESDKRSKVSQYQENKSGKQFVSFKGDDSFIRNEQKVNSMSSVNSSLNIEPSIKMFENDLDSQDQYYDAQIDHEFVQNMIHTQTKKISERFQQKIAQTKVEQEQKSNNLQQVINQIQQKLITQKQLNQWGQKLRQQLASRQAAMKQQLSVNLVYIKHQLFQYCKSLIASLEQNDKRLINQKVQISYFEQSMNNLTTAINDQLAKQEKHFANKVQTKRAIQFLDVKLNRLITQQFNSNIKSKKHMSINQDVCLKINKVQSSKKFEMPSQKSIRDKLQDNQGVKSLETSMHMIEIQKNNQEAGNKINRVISQLITWKNPGLHNSGHSQNAQKSSFKMIRSSSKSRESHGTPAEYKHLSKPEPQSNVNLKEWRQKVIKVLKKEDRRKRKVTFR